MKPTIFSSFKGRTGIKRLSSDVIIGVVVTIIATIIINFFPIIKSYLLKSFNVPLFMMLLFALIIFLFTFISTRMRDRIIIDKLKEEASKDRFLTKAYAKDQTPILLMKHIQIANTSNESFSVIYVDIDDFRNINQLHGHDSADFILQQFVERIQPRSTEEYLIREGGEEFLIITKLIGVNEAAIEGLGFANRLRSEVQKDPFLIKRGKGETCNLTISCGVAEYIKGDTVPTIKNRAEGAMREAKKTKNCVILA